MKRYTRWTTAGAATLAVALILSACTTPGEDSPASTGNEAIKTLQFVNPLPGNDVWEGISGCFEDEAAAQGIEYTVSGPPASQPADATVMIQQIQDATAAGKDAIVTFPASAAFGPVLQQAQDAGVLTATLYGDGSPESGATVNSGVDWGVIGTKYVEAIAALPGDHVIGLVAQAPTGVGKSWIDGVTAAVGESENVTIAGTVFIGADASQALPQVSALLTAHPDIDIVASNTGIMTTGGVAAIDSLGLKGQVYLLVIGNENGGPASVTDGYSIGVYLQDLCDLAKRTIVGLVDASTGETVPLIQVSDVIATSEDVADYLAKGWN